MMLFGTTRPASADPVAALCAYVLKPLAYCAPFCLSALFIEQPMYRISALCLEQHSQPMVLLLYIALVLFFGATFSVLSLPLERAVRDMLPPVDYVVHTTYNQSGRTSEEYPGLRLFCITDRSWRLS